MRAGVEETAHPARNLVTKHDLANKKNTPPPAAYPALARRLAPWNPRNIPPRDKTPLTPSARRELTEFRFAREAGPQPTKLLFLSRGMARFTRGDDKPGRRVSGPNKGGVRRG